MFSVSEAGKFYDISTNGTITLNNGRYDNASSRRGLSIFRATVTSMESKKTGNTFNGLFNKYTM